MNEPTELSRPGSKALTAPPTERCRIRLHNVWGHHSWISGIKGETIESSHRQDMALVMPRRKANRLLRRIREQCPNALLEPEPVVESPIRWNSGIASLLTNHP